MRTTFLPLFSALRNLAEVRSFACKSNSDANGRTSASFRASLRCFINIPSWQIVDVFRWFCMQHRKCKQFIHSFRTFALRKLADVRSFASKLNSDANERTSDRMRTFPAAHDFFFDFVPKVVDSYAVEPMTRSTAVRHVALVHGGHRRKAMYVLRTCMYVCCVCVNK